MADYIDAEERRFAALDSLATIQSGSPAGLVAKAKALNALSLAEDPDRRAAIAASLADDVLRCFNPAA
ncbi:MAG: hypothetical protein WCB70_19215 [Xanthobacteraceae bacterium]